MTETARKLEESRLRVARMKAETAALREYGATLRALTAEAEALVGPSLRLIQGGR